jgi:lipopolysaccharide transport system ATP-binding protein
VLSVGDMAFQEKCVARMREFKRTGVAIVFVSHNMQAVTDLCEEAIYLQSSVKAQGAVLDVVGTYIQSTRSEAPNVRSGVEIDKVRLTTGGGAPVTTVAPGTPLTLEARYSVREALVVPVFEVTVFRSMDNVIAYEGQFSAEQMGISNLAAGAVYVVRFTLRANLTRGQYHIGLYVIEGATDRWVAIKSPAAALQVSETRSYRGIADLGVTVEVTEQSATLHRPLATVPPLTPGVAPR